MKHIPAITAALLLGCSSIAANAQSTEQVLGAIAGGALGSTIGDGDGRKAATVIGAIIGYRNGEVILGTNDDYYHESYSDRRYRFERYCYREVPEYYLNDRNVANSWVRGCVQKLQKRQRELERQAYLDGLRD
jgi:hypothetical protein